MSVVGLDLGNLNCYISVARAGGIETATNDYSLHATPACVQFGEKARLVGVPAKNAVLTNIRNTIFNFKNLIGRSWADPVVQEERKWLPFETVEIPGGGLGFVVEMGGERKVLTAPQIVAILLVKLRESAEAFLKGKVHDCVIAVPSFWTDLQRRALMDAAAIADLNCLRIINETTAVALAYGIYKQDLPAETEKPRHIAFVDIGHTTTQAAVVAFHKGKLKVLATAYDTGFGGRAFDRLLQSHFTKQFKEKFHVDAASRDKPFQRLLDECERLKKLMSANSQAIPLSIECFMDEKDVKGEISRADFEELAKDLWPRLPALLQRLMTAAKLKTADMDAVEIVGGSSRFPKIKSIVTDFFGQEPKTTLNQDEAVSRGAALQCAMLSPTFRVREFAVQDAQPFAIRVEWDGTADAENGEMIVFDEGEPFPFSKIISFYRKEGFSIRASYAYPNAIPYPTPTIGSFAVTKVTPDKEGGSSKVKVKVRLNPNGLFLVSSASMLEKKTEEAEEEEMNGVEEGKKKEETEVPSNNDQPMETGDATNGEAKEGEAPIKPGSQAKPTKSKVKSVELPVVEKVGGLSNQELEAMRNVERSMQAADRREAEKAEARNSLETYVYEMRDKVSDGGVFAPFVVSSEAESFVSKLSLTEEWIYAEGEDEEKSVYESRLNELRNIGDPIAERASEAELRPQAWANLRASIVKTRKFVDAAVAGDVKYEHIDEKDVGKVRKLLEDKEAWADKHEGAQNARDKTLPPLVFVNQIRSETEALDRMAQPIMSKPKPKVQPPPEPQPTADANVDPNAPTAAHSDPEAQMPGPQSNAPQMEVD